MAAALGARDKGSLPYGARDWLLRPPPLVARDAGVGFDGLGQVNGIVVAECGDTRSRQTA